MAGVAKAEAAGGIDPRALEAIATMVRGEFKTVEDMTQSFIREAITQGVFPPGQRLNMDLIASTLGVSRMPVRASLRQLEGEGLLTIHPYRGAMVSVLGAKEVAEIYEMRVLLELYLLERAMDDLDDTVLEKLRVIVHDLEATDERTVWLDKRNDFYTVLYRCADRPRALAQVNHLRGSVGRYLLLQRVDEHPVHEELFTFIESGDVDKAKAWLASHLKHVSLRLQELVSAAGDDQ